MRKVLGLAGVGVAVALGLIWASGGFSGLQGWILDSQRQAQSTLAGAVRAIKAGQAGAIWGLLAVSFTYGFLHAAGPGHGKLVIGGYGMGRRVPMLRLGALALISSLAQAAVAVALVYGAVGLFGLARAEAEGLAEKVMAPFGLAMVAGVGLWLMLRGIRGVRANFGAGQGGDHHPHDHHLHDPHPHDPHPHDHPATNPATCEVCGHAHGPTLEQIEHLTGWRDTAAMVAGIALRPCSGALFLLILTWQLGIGGAGILGTFAMGLGTALVTIAVAVMAVFAREGALASLPGQSAARALPWFELIAGTVVAFAALSLLRLSL